MIRIRTLGGLSVSSSGEPVSGPGTQPRRLALLALVARAGDRGITRDKLLALLWPDADDESGRRALSQALHAVRRDLGADDLFLGVQDLRLNQALATCDVVEFETALSGGDLVRAVGVYGGPFLEGFRLAGADELNRWLEEERSALALRYADTLERLGRQAAEAGDHLAAVTWWRQRAALDPLNARVTVELMQALAASGERHAAIQQARIYEALLAQELELAPDAEVLRLAEALRHATDSPPRSLPVTVTKERPGEATHPPPAVPGAAATAPARPAAMARLIRAPVVAAVVLLMILAGFLALRRPGGTPAGVVLAVGEITDFRGVMPGGAAPASDMLATNLARVDGLQVLSSLRVLELVDRQRGSANPRVRVAAAARAAGATELLEGGLHRLGDDRLLLELRRVDLASGEVRSAWRLEGRDLFELVARATTEIAAGFGRRGLALDPGDVSTRSLVAYRFYEEGLRSFSRGEYRTARSLFETALREDSSFAMAAYYRWLTTGPLQLPPDSGEVERLERLAVRATERESLLIRGFVAIALQSQAVVAVAETLAVRFPAEVDGHYLLGYGRMVQGQFGAALPHLRRVIELDSSAITGGRARCQACDAVDLMVTAYQAIDSLERAEAVARDWTNRDPESQRAWALLAGILSAAGRHDESLAARRRAMARPYDSYDAVFPSILQVRAGHFRSAEAALRPMLAQGGESGWQARWLLFIALRHQSRWDEALALMRPGPAGPARDELIRLAELLRICEALVLMESGRGAEAARIWDSLARHPNPALRAGGLARRQAIQYVLLAEAALTAGDTALLARSADSVSAWAGRGTNPRDHHMTDHARGLLAMARGDTAEAVGALTRAIFSPTIGFTRTNLHLARLHIARGRPAEAVPLLRAALRGWLDGTNLYVRHTDLHRELARAFAALGRPDSAEAHRRWGQD